MSRVEALLEADVEFLDKYLPATGSQYTQTSEESWRPPRAARYQRPFVTLTYASSLDSMISLAPGVRTTLSGPETKSMTHYLRSKHDAILVGVGTALADDPGLNCRYPRATLRDQPRPLILDPEGRWPMAVSEAQRLALVHQGKQPWPIHTVESAWQRLSRGGQKRLWAFDNVGNILDRPLETPRKVQWRSILNILHAEGIESVMIEGGATIINDLLSQPDLVDSVVITIAPTWLGQGGVAVSPPPQMRNDVRVNAGSLKDTSWRQFGKDVVLCGRLAK